jgi:hypothetical protein
MKLKLRTILIVVDFGNYYNALVNQPIQILFFKKLRRPMKTGRAQFRGVLIWAGGLFIIGSTIVFLLDLDSYWIPATIGFFFILAVIIYLVMGGFGVE